MASSSGRAQPISPHRAFGNRITTSSLCEIPPSSAASRRTSRLNGRGHDEASTSSSSMRTGMQAVCSPVDMQVGRIKSGDPCQASPIEHFKLMLAKFHEAFSSKPLHGAIDRDVRHPKRLPELALT